MSDSPSAEQVVVDSDPVCDCKIGSVCQEYDVSGLIAELGQRYQAEKTSLRKLATWFNVEILRSALHAAGVNLLDGEAENMFRLLNDDEVSTGNVIQVENRLTKHGIDPDRLQSQFVSYQTVNRHLKQCLDISPERPQRSSEDRVEKATDRLHALESRTEKVVKKTLEQLDNSDAITLGDPEVIVTVSVMCSECGTYSQLDELINNGGCNCTGNSA